MGLNPMQLYSALLSYPLFMCMHACISICQINTIVILNFLQVPGVNYLSANISFENYLTDETIQKAWNKAQKNVNFLHLYILPEPKLVYIIDKCM